MDEAIAGVLALLFIAWTPWVVIAAVIGNRRQGAGWGALLGLFFGPLGCILAFAVECRPQCPQCYTRLDGRATICPACHATLDWFFGHPLSPEAVAVRKAAIIVRKARDTKRADAMRRRWVSTAHIAWQSILQSARTADQTLEAVVGRDNSLVLGFFRGLAVAAIAAALLGVVWLLAG